MDRFHIQGMAKDKCYPFLLAEISKPVPGEHTFNTNKDIFTIRGNGFQKLGRLAVDITVEKDSSLPIQDAEEHFFA
jgi:hypothetical protein